jgi:hypothetical protein
MSLNLEVDLEVSCGGLQKENWRDRMSDPILWRKENGVSVSSTPPMPFYTDTMNKFMMSATAFMEHVHLLTEARDAYHTAIAASTSIRSNLDAGDRALRSLMGEMDDGSQIPSREVRRDRQTRSPETRSAAVRSRRNRWRKRNPQQEVSSLKNESFCHRRSPSVCFCSGHFFHNFQSLDLASRPTYCCPASNLSLLSFQRDPSSVPWQPQALNS